MRRPVAVLALLAVVLLAVACGRPQTEIQTLPTGPLTQGQYEDAFNVSAAGLAPKYGVGKPLDPEASAQEQAEHVAGLQRLLRDWAGRIGGTAAAGRGAAGTGPLRRRHPRLRRRPRPCPGRAGPR